MPGFWGFWPKNSTEIHNEIFEKGTPKMFTKTAIAAAFAISMLTAPAIAGDMTDSSDDIHWILTLELADGQDATFEELMAEMVTATKSEAGAKGYEWHRNGQVVHIIERYETNEDAGIHLGNFGANFAERFLAILAPTGLQVYGPAEGGVREGLAGFGASFYDQVGGFSG
jgi:quinol monooxygenase YgiN